MERDLNKFYWSWLIPTLLLLASKRRVFTDGQKVL